MAEVVPFGDLESADTNTYAAAGVALSRGHSPAVQPRAVCMRPEGSDPVRDRPPRSARRARNLSMRLLPAEVSQIRTTVIGIEKPELGIVTVVPR